MGTPAPATSVPQSKEKEREMQIRSFEEPKVEEKATKKIESTKNDLEEDNFNAPKENTNVELIGSIENFDSDLLVPVKTKEPPSGLELVKQELSHDSVKSEVKSFDMESLKKTNFEDKNWLPDQEVINQEKEKVDHLMGIESFDTDTLTKVKTPEPISGAEILKNELNKKAIGEEVESYNKDALRHVDVDEKNILPD